MLRHLLIASTAVIVIGVMAAPAQALTMQECSAKYQAAKKANPKTAKWNDFRKAECGDDDEDDNAAAAAVKEEPKPAPARAAAPAPAPASPARAAAPAPAPAPAAAPARPATAAAPAAAPAATPASAPPKVTGRIVYPRAIDKDFANETPGKARLKTCAKQYQANKTSNTNGGLTWIQEGGGYWSLCNKKLKEAA
ncbi:MAG: hypothetical protein ACRCXM_04290 [Beijerinckiaceae bacterium]